MIRKAILPVLGLAVAMVFASPTKASAEVYVGVNIGPVVPRPGYVVLAPSVLMLIVTMGRVSRRCRWWCAAGISITDAGIPITMRAGIMGRGISAARGFL